MNDRGGKGEDTAAGQAAIGLERKIRHDDPSYPTTVMGVTSNDP